MSENTPGQKPGHTAGEAGDTTARLRSSHLPALATFVVVLVASGALALVSHHVSERQERALLRERANEASSLLASATGDARTVLRAAGAVAAEQGQSTLFTTITQGLQAEVVAARETDGTFTAIARSGLGATAIGARVPDDIVASVRRAQTAKDMTADILGTGSHRSIVLAMGVPAATPGKPGVVAYMTAPVSPRGAAPSGPDSPYRELDAAVYAGTRADAERLVLVSGDKPDPHGPLVTRTFKVGADTWLVEVSPREPLVGSLASAFPWVAIGIGTLLALLLALLVDVLAQRRAYALTLVEERTRSLQEARLAAEKANRAKSEFLSRMSHELRTPLNAVLGFGQLLEMDGLTPEQAENVGQITKGGAHLLDLINEILDISQIETGHISLSPEAVRVSEVTEAAVSLLRPLAEERAVHLIGGADHGCDHYIFADRQRLKQILLNLVGNGIKYNRQGGSVSISCFQPVRGRLRIQVTDTGPGIAADQLPLLFAPFERLGAEQTSVPGTGVGLALSRGLAEAMGGTIDVESTPGRGSTFWVEFPIVESPVKMYEVAQQPPTPKADDGLLTVLHIEDNLANVELVERVLAQRPDITVLPAMQGRMGIDLARRYRPVLILLDLNLVDLPGAEVLTILRDDPRTADIPVVIVSADAMPRQVQRLLSSGALAYLTKPIDIHRLLELVDDAVARVRSPEPRG